MPRFAVHHQRIQKARRVRLGRGDHATGADQVQRQRRANQTRQALRAQRAGQQPQLDLGHAEARVGARHAMMASHRQFETAAEHRAVQRGHHRPGARLDATEQAVERLGAEPRYLERGDVAASHERAAGAVQHQRVEPAVALESVKGIHETCDDRG
jgi:hypothetical protein